jgi:ribosomal protein S17
MISKLELSKMSIEELRDLNHSVIDAIKNKRKINAIKMSSSLQVGDTVRINQSKEAGKTFQVTQIKQVNCVIKQLNGARAGTAYNCSMGLLVKIK